LISVWQLGSAHRAGYLAVIHLGSALNLRRMVGFSFCPHPLLRQGVLRLICLLRNFFRAALSSKSGGPALRFLDA
jgi:hypothetical protein